MRILAADFSPRSGGVFGAVLGQAQALRQAGRAVEIIAVQPPDSPPEALSDSIVVRNVPATGPLVHSRAPGLEAVLEQSGFVHAHGLWIPSISIATRRWRRARADRRLIVSPHGMLDPWALRNSAWKKRIAIAAYEGATLRAADALQALNESEARAIRGFGLTAPIAIIPNGVVLPPESEVSIDATERHDGRRNLLFLGRLHPKKGLVETLNAWALAIGWRPRLREQWRIVIAGWDDGGHQAKLRALVADLDLTRDVRFLGSVHGDLKHAALAGADAFILASHSEGLPMAVLEAWAYAKPVFMTAACNLPEGFQSGAAIEISTDPVDLGGVLSENLMSADLALVGRAGRQLVEARFSWDSVGRQLDVFYSWISGEISEKPDFLFI